MNKRNTIISFLFFLMMIFIILLNNDDLEELYKLHDTDKLLILNTDGSTKDLIENENVFNYFHCAFTNKSKFPVDIDQWEEIAIISFYNKDKKIMNGRIIRLNVEAADKDIFERDLGHMKPVNNYYYLYTVDVKKLIFKKTYCSSIDESLIMKLKEIEQLPSNP